MEDTPKGIKWLIITRNSDNLSGWVF